MRAILLVLSAIGAMAVVLALVVGLGLVRLHAVNREAERGDAATGPSSPQSQPSAPSPIAAPPVAPPQPIELWVGTPNAELFGKGTRVDHTGQAFFVFGADPRARIRWSTEVPGDGEYAVDLCYSSPSKMGGDFVVMVGDQPLRGHTQGTGKAYLTLPVGTVRLQRGPIYVSVGAGGPVKFNLMNLRGVRLSPVAAKSK